MKHLITPNLPTSRVKNVLSGRHGNNQILTELKNRGIAVIETDSYKVLNNAVSSHADLLFHHLGGRLIIAYKLDSETARLLVELGFDVLQAESNIRSPYPHDVALDAARVANYLICNPLHTDQILLEYAREKQLDIIKVRQGYAKCSVCVVDENAIITSDSGIAAAAIDRGIEVLQIQNGYIELKGYEYGFIGGSCGKIAPDTMCFTGDLGTHPDHLKMVDFLKAHGVKAVSLGNGPLVDIGGIIPLTEE